MFNALFLNHFCCSIRNHHDPLCAKMDKAVLLDAGFDPVPGMIDNILHVLRRGFGDRVDDVAFHVTQVCVCMLTEYLCFMIAPYGLIPTLRVHEKKSVCPSGD